VEEEEENLVEEELTLVTAEGITAIADALRVNLWRADKHTVIDPSPETKYMASGL
jgi:hypothetical protein